MSGIVYTPQPDHECAPGWTWTPLKGDEPALAPRVKGGMYGTPPNFGDFPRGTVWECDCHTTWVSQGITGGRQPTGGYAAGGLEWKLETKRARRKRERQGITSEQVFGGYQGGRPAADVRPPPKTPSGASGVTLTDWRPTPVAESSTEPAAPPFAPGPALMHQSEGDQRTIRRYQDGARRLLAEQDEQAAEELRAAASPDTFGHGPRYVLLDPQDVSTVFDPETEQVIGYVYYLLLPGSFGPTWSLKSGEIWPHVPKPVVRSETCPEQDFPLVLASLGPTMVGPKLAGQVEPELGGKNNYPNVAARGTEPERIRHPIGILAAIDAGHRRFELGSSHDSDQGHRPSGNGGRRGRQGSCSCHRARHGGLRPGPLTG